MNISLTSYIHQVTELMYVTNNGTTLAGVLSYYIYSQLYFHNNIRVKFHGVSGILEESLEALRDGLADFSGSPIHLDNKIDHLLLNRYNVGILGVNGWIECCLIHKALLNKPAISVLQTVFSTSKIFKHYIFSFLIVFLVISSLKDVSRVTLGLKFLKLFIQKYQPKNDYKKVSMFVLLVSLTLTIFLVSAFLITDCISLNEPQTLSDIKDLNEWKFTELVTVSGLCDNEVKFIVKQQGLENDYIQTDLEYINTASLTKNDAGLTLLAAYQSDFYTLFLLYCTKDYQDCLYHFFHHAKPFKSIFLSRLYRKNIGKREFNFLSLYSNSIRENGMWIAMLKDFGKFYKKEYDPRSILLFERKIEKIAMRPKLTFVKLILQDFSALIFLSFIVFIFF